MHKNYNSCLHILDMHVERGETSVFTKKTNSSFRDCTDQVVFDLVGNQEDRFFYVAAHLITSQENRSLGF